MLDELIRSNAVDKRWAEEMIAAAASLEELERAAIGTADNRWRIPRFNGRAVVDEARHMARIQLTAGLRTAVRPGVPRPRTLAAHWVGRG